MKWYYLSPLLLQKIFWIPVRLILTVFGRLEVHGLENLNDIKGNVIFAANHTSELDPILIPASLPLFSRFSPMFYPVREKNFYDESGWRKHLFGGSFINMWGGYPVYVGLHDYDKSLVHHVRVLKEGGSLCVFPEGGRSPDGSIQNGKGGVAFLMDRTGTPIVPIGISGVFRTRPSDFFGRRRVIVVTFGQPIYQKEIRAYSNAHLAGIKNIYKVDAQYVMRKIGELVKSPAKVAEREGSTVPVAS